MATTYRCTRCGRVLLTREQAQQECPNDYWGKQGFALYSHHTLPAEALSDPKFIKRVGGAP